jgi:Xaa-Pro aminopeptidase
MSRLSERLIAPVSDQELDRRWRATRAVMAAENIAALVVENNNNSVGGYIQWFTGIPATDGMPLAAVFPGGDAMTVICQGRLDTVRQPGPDGDGIFRGVREVRATAYFPAVNYTKGYEAALLADALMPYRHQRIGLVGPYQMLYATVSQLRAALGGAAFVDASDLVDRIKIVKSPEEIGLIRRTAANQDVAIDAAIKAIAPGRTDRDVAVVAQNVSRELGSDQGFALCASAPPGEPAIFAHSHLQGRVIGEGDVVNLLVENSGPGGMWSEVGRTITVGSAPGELAEDFEVLLAAQAHTMRLIRPGAVPAEIWEAHNTFMTDHGRPPERRIHCHGQGYDLVERPLIRFDETLAIPDSLNLACHPAFVSQHAFCSLTDGFIVTAAGAERLHATPQRIFEV